VRPRCKCVLLTVTTPPTLCPARQDPDTLPFMKLDPKRMLSKASCFSQSQITGVGNFADGKTRAVECAGNDASGSPLPCVRKDCQPHHAANRNKLLRRTSVARCSQPGGASSEIQLVSAVAARSFLPATRSSEIAGGGPSQARKDCQDQGSSAMEEARTFSSAPVSRD